MGVCLGVDVERLRAGIHEMGFEEAEALFAALGSPAPKESYPQSKIEHFVVLYHENHAFDHIFGCLDLPGIDGVSNGTVNATCGTSEYVCDHGPSFSLFAGKFYDGSESQCRSYPYDPQSDEYSVRNLGDSNTTTQMYSPEQLPVKTAIAENFGVFNRLFTAVPTNSMPNHMFTQTGTSCGAKDNVFPWTDCNGSSLLYPQWSLYDQLHVDGVDFGIFFSYDDLQPPDGYMKGLLRHLPKWRSMTDFKLRARLGTLPAFSWVVPRYDATDHPCRDNREGEAVQKEVYETLRASPVWNKTLLAILYDDGGGYYDHVVPPFEGVPADGAACSEGIDECSDPFDFRRLGLRSAALLASPWIPKGSVFQEPTNGKYNTSRFDLTSVISTARDLFGLSSNLTARDDWSASFYELLAETEPRTDTPETLPDAPTITSSEDQPQHCAAKDGVCRGPDALTNKQRRDLPLYSLLTNSPLPPDYETTMSSADATAWLRHRVRHLLQNGVHPEAKKII
ncbi:hypothetical protein CTAYLR_008686 [Chrysophaeum taylorii]|uniref:Phospholipase C n=1 Tax=Chrysophaeum taylorii TaxID=2483200 RepID=A0AAD7UNN2_9STRA|nr:hypothetical protein CTAYLR_008686 [Chrysophaeum taylorii]